MTVRPGAGERQRLGAADTGAGSDIDRHLAVEVHSGVLRSS
jgi:hypothetical protein